MAHLICVRHQRRAYVFDKDGKAVSLHRADGELCKGSVAYAGRIFTPDEVVVHTQHQTLSKVVFGKER